ncbi:MAG TPA: circadian clock protein KaiC [Woeseiaceae bacterium]|nr:circadian clock protein KaiC [Woeseiaceae bacterium]
MNAIRPGPLPKTPTGIEGLDEVTGGGLPTGRPTLICGSAGCGKTLLSASFLVNGAARYGEPGVFITFEETADELGRNVASLGYDLDALQARKLLVVDHVHVDRSDIEELGAFDLDGLFIRLKLAIDSVGAKRIVIDTLESLFQGFDDQATLRAELRRLLRWLKDRGITAIVTGERGDRSLTRNGIEEYVSDCVILLDHRVNGHVSTRHLRVVKYRGSAHGTNEYPFLIDEDGITVMPITSAALEHRASEERLPTGIPALDGMLRGGGYFRGSTILVSGTAGTGKSSVAAHLAMSTCERGERCLFFAFEESEAQYLRNMRSIGLHLAPHVESGLMRFRAVRPTLQGLEMHLVQMQKLVRDLEPAVVIVDPISNLVSAGSAEDARSLMTRLIDFLKSRGTTAMLTNLSTPHGLEETDLNVSSIADTWLLLRDVESDGERRRILFVLKSRGMAHSNRLHEFLITDRGVDLVPVEASAAVAETTARPARRQDARR